MHRWGSLNFLQFAIRTSKASRPRRTPGTALPVRKAARVQAVTCLAQLALPHELGRSQGEAATALNLHSPAATGHPSIQSHQRLSIKKKNLVERELCEEHFRFGDMACTPMHSLPPRVAAAPRRAHHRSPRLVATRRCSVGHRAETCASASQSPACPCKMSACSSWSASYFLP